MAKPPDTPKPRPAKPTLADDDAALFDSAMRDVKKFGGKDGKPAAPPIESPASLKPSPPRARRPAPQIKSTATLPSLAAGTSADVDARTMDRLRRGRLRPEARLDLHGMTQEKAHRALDRFIFQAQSSGLRSVIIITGKGRVSEGGGVLRNQVPQWLNAPGIRPSVLAFAPAQPRDGGAGALYVLLRKQR